MSRLAQNLLVLVEWRRSVNHPQFVREVDDTLRTLAARLIAGDAA
jgi:hypothetical protein